VACAAGFTLLQGANAATAAVQGSALYISRTTTTSWTRFLTKGAMCAWTYDCAIAHVAVTSDLDAWGDTYNYQYVLWTIRDPAALHVYGLPLPPNDIIGDPYASMDVWVVVPFTATADVYALVDLAVAPWSLPQTPPRLNAHPPLSANTYAVAIVCSNGGEALWAYFNTLSVSLIGSVGNINWGNALARIGLFATQGNYPNASVVETAADGHSNLFYVAFNAPPAPGVRALSTSGVVALSPVYAKVSAQLTIVSAVTGAGARLTAMAVLPSPDGSNGVYLYLATESDANVQLVKWLTPATASATVTIDDGSLDEYFAPTTASSIQQLSFLWPSLAATAPQLLALTQQRGVVLVADTTQRTFTALQDLPFPTRPTSLVATGTDVGSALLLGAAGTDVYVLRASYCATDSGGVPRYWDGATCQRHACVRARSCNTALGQIWSVSQFKCVCSVGWYSASATTCAQCAADVSGKGYYCPGNGTQVACPVSMTSPVAAKAQADCLCRLGQFYNPLVGSCQICPAGAYCPDQWSLVPCPGTVDSARSSAGLVYPQGCVCAAGYMGANCLPCPDGYYCPAGTAAAETNSAVLLTLSSSATTPTASFCSTTLIAGVLLPAFSVGSVPYLVPPLSDAAVATRIYCHVIPPPTARPNARPLVALMIQTEVGDAANSILVGLPGLLVSNLTSVLTGISGSQPTKQPSAQQVASNTAVQCGTGRTPDPSATMCICSPGYETSGQQCGACLVGYFKAASNAGKCTVCPLGTSTAAVASTACVLLSDLKNASSSSPSGNNNSNNPSSANSNTMLVVYIGAGVVGGLLLVGGLIWMVMSMSASSSSS
jgi:hypothetical protein